MSRSPSQLIEALVKHWMYWDAYEEFYLTKLAPALVVQPKSGDEAEKAILQELRPQLNDDEWKALPQLIAEKRKGILREVESEKLKREAQERERQESERKRREAEAEAERERLRQERLRKETEDRKRNLLAKIDQCLQHDFLKSEEFFRSQSQGLLSNDEFEVRKLSFVRKWFADRAKALGAKISTPDDEQLAAIAAVNGHVQVVARAGSGKTATLVNRALFLMMHCKVSASSLLLLAFNRKAATEIRRRLLAHLHPDGDNLVQRAIEQRRAAAQRHRRRFDVSDAEVESVSEVATGFQIELPHVMTFHALAYAIVHPEEAILYNDTDEQNQTLNRVFQSVIDDHLRQPAYQAQVRELMLAHFKEDWGRIVAGGHVLSQEEFLQLRRSLPRESLAGEYVKSWGEKLIADFLFEHDVTYKYERNHWWSGVNYRPDFTIFKTERSGVIIEYFGLAGEPEYDEMSEQKRGYWTKKPNWDLLEFDPQDIAQGKEVFWARLKACLEKHAITCRKLSEDEIWLRIRDRSIDRFTKAMVGFVGRCRKQSLMPSTLQQKIDAHSALSPVERMFLRLSKKLYAAYLERLAETGEDDFDGLMQRAAVAVENGCTTFQRKTGGGDLTALKFVFIDEFQDFSDLFFRLLQSIRKVNPEAYLFCVGDDWQAINGFAGSNLLFFEKFNKFIGEGRQLYISTNYRSVQSVVGIGNALMSGFGKPAVARQEAKTGEVVLVDTSKFQPSEIEKRDHSGDIITPMAFRLAKRSLLAGHDVVLLARMNALPWHINFINPGDGKGLDGYLALIRSLFPPDLGERITISTAHSYKGLQKPAVIMLDAVAKRFPLVHPDWVFSRILGNSVEKIIQEERRLFYVALTRAIDKLIIITDGNSQSPFLDDIQSRMSLTSIDWNDYPAGPAHGRPRSLVVKIFNTSRFVQAGGTYAIREQLKACGYRFQNTGQACWTKPFLTEGFDLASIRHELWGQGADGVTVAIHGEDEQQVFGVFTVNQGTWQQIQNDLNNLLAFSADD